MPVNRIFRGRQVKRTHRVGADKIRLFYNDGKGKTGQQEVVLLEVYRREVKSTYAPPESSKSP